jgi:uncharacterized protein
MAALPEIVSKAWEDREGPVVLSTVDKDGIPNAIYAGSVSKYSEEIIVVADNYFSKTLENIQTGSKGSILFITSERKSYQIKGSIVYLTEGAVFNDMKTWNPTRHPGRAAVGIQVEEVYSGAKKLI